MGVVEKVREVVLYSRQREITVTPNQSLSGGHGVYCMDNHDRMLAVGGGDGKASLWHLNDNDQTGRFEINRIKVLTGHTAPINAIKFDPTGAILATASNDKVSVVLRLDYYVMRIDPVSVEYGRSFNTSE